MATQNTTGHNWGDVTLEDGILKFSISERPVFKFPLSRISQSVMQGKSEVSLELEEGDIDPTHDTLVEMKFWVPEGDAKADEDGDDDADEISSAMRFHRQLSESADTGDKAQTLCEFAEWNVQVPRGRYAVKFYPNHVSLHGKTFTHKILYKSITKMFLLQTVDWQHHLFVLGVDPPVRQGRTSYHYIVIQFSSEDRTSTTINMTEDAIREYGETLKPTMEGYVYDIAAMIFKAFTKKKQVIIAGSYKNSKEQPAVYCSYKANEGYLYILEKSIFFLKKPALYIRNDQIVSLEFARLQNTQGSKSFDLQVAVQGSEETHLFAGIARTEYASLFKNFEDKKLPITNIKAAKNLVTKTGRFTTAANMNEDDPYKGKLDEELEDAEEDSEDDADFKAGSDGSSDEEGEGDEGDESMAEEAPTDEENEPERPAESSKLPKKRKAPSGEEKKPREKAEKGKKKAAKDKNAPKRGMNAFMCFAQKKRADVKAENPTLKPTEVGAKLGELWAKMDTEAKAQYEELAKADKARYNEAMKTYVAPEKAESDGETGGKKKRREKKEKKPGPKKAPSAWQFFVSKHQPEMMTTDPDLSFVGRGKKIAAMWKALTPEDKAPFEAQAVEAKSKYATELAQFEEKTREEETQRKADKAKRKEEKRARREARKAEGGGADGEENGERQETKEERRKRRAEKKEKKRLKKEKKEKKKRKEPSGDTSEQEQTKMSDNE